MDIEYTWFRFKVILRNEWSWEQLKKIPLHLPAGISVGFAILLIFHEMVKLWPGSAKALAYGSLGGGLLFWLTLWLVFGLGELILYLEGDPEERAKTYDPSRGPSPMRCFWMGGLLFFFAFGWIF